MVDFSGESAILASGVEELYVDGPKLPTAITQIVYREPGVKWFNFVALAVVFSNGFPLICEIIKSIFIGSSARTLHIPITEKVCRRDCKPSLKRKI